MHLTKKKALFYFKETILPAVKFKHEYNGQIDIPARREAWNDFTDRLFKDGLISEKQLDTWYNPF